MKLSAREALAANFSEYCRLLAKVQEECKDTLLTNEKENLRQHAHTILTTGLAFREGSDPGFGNTMYLRLKPGTDLTTAELDVGAIHRNFSDQTLSGVVNNLAGSMEVLRGYYEEEPTVFVTKPHNGTPNRRHLTFEWIRWYKRRHPGVVSIREIGNIGGQRIHEHLVKEGTSPLLPGDTLKVTVHSDDSIWDGNDLPISLWNVSPKEF